MIEHMQLDGEYIAYMVLFAPVVLSLLTYTSMYVVVKLIHTTIRCDLQAHSTFALHAACLLGVIVTAFILYYMVQIRELDRFD